MTEAVPKIDTLSIIQAQTGPIVNEDRERILATNRSEKKETQKEVRKEIKAAYGLTPENLLALTDSAATRGCVFPLEFCADPNLQATVNRVWKRTPKNLLTVQEVLGGPDLTWDNSRVFRFFLAWEVLMGITNPSILEEVRKEMKGVDDYTRILDQKIEFLRRKTS